MRPLIGITTDIREDAFLVPRAYGDVIARVGGFPILLSPADVAACIRGRGEQHQGGGDGGYASALAEMLDGLLIPGGGDISPCDYGEEVAVEECLLTPVSDKRVSFERALIDAVILGGKPLLAICYGMQLLNVHFGGTLYQDIEAQRPGSDDHSRGAHQIECHALGECLGLSSPCRVNTSHHQAVKTLGAGLDVIARADDGIIEGIWLAGHSFVVGVQWHPERGMDHLSERLFEEFVCHARSCAAERPARA